MKRFASHMFRIALLCIMFGGSLNAQEAGTRACVRGSVYSPTLKAEFLIQKMHIPGHIFYAARIVSELEPESPLHQAGLKMGDVITRLDGIPVSNYRELDQHYGRTYVRYIRQGTITVRNTVIDLDEHTGDEGTVRP